MATPQVKDLVLHSPAGSSEVITFTWPLLVGTGQDKHDNGIDIIDTIKFVCDEMPSISSAFEEINLNQIDTACYKTMTNLVDRFNKAVDSIVALEKGTSLPAERLNKFAHPSLLRHILQLVYNAAVSDPDKLNNYEPFSPEVYGETSYELVQQMIKHVDVTNEDTFIDLGSGVGQVVLQMAGSFPLKACIGIERADTPARYAERMDLFFRQFMAWFGKRYCEYKLIKGDFLVDEHREKITNSTLVFVNNFAFGPTVDHQLKERFADLRDGARIVSSKSFCPLNFRITDRNLSDIGTIMHVSEIPPLKGSVSWTCKPVSYYLHVIDRTILERYFQRLKTQKGADHEHGGSVRTTRDRAKREANNHANNKDNSLTARTSSPANARNNNNKESSNNNNNNNSNNNNNHNNNIISSNTTTNNNKEDNSNSSTTASGAAAGNSSSNLSSATTTTTSGGNTTAKTRQQQRNNNNNNNNSNNLNNNSNSNHSNSNKNSGGINPELESSTESDNEALANGLTNGPTTRKLWSDWCSSKGGKSSQSDDEENNNSNTTSTNRSGGRNTINSGAIVNTTQKKRKKLTRKAAIASKSAAAAAQREAAAREREAAAAAQAVDSSSKASNSKHFSGKDDNGSNSSTSFNGKGGRKGRIRKGTARGRKNIKIVGLDILHKETLLSTSHEAMNKKLPPAPGCIDQQLTSLLTADMAHTELDIPDAPQDTPYALQILLNVFRSQYMAMIDQMKSKSYLSNIKKHIQQEQERKQRLKNRASQLDKQIKVLIDDSVALLKVRMNELGINVSSPNDLIAKAKEIVGRHKELQCVAKKIQSQVTAYELEQKKLLKKHIQNLPEYQKSYGGSNNGKVKLELIPASSCSGSNMLSNGFDISETVAQELVLREIANTLSQRKKLYAQVSSIEKEAAALEKAAEERRTANALLAQGTNMTLAPINHSNAINIHNNSNHNHINNNSNSNPNIPHNLSLNSHQQQQQHFSSSLSALHSSHQHSHQLHQQTHVTQHNQHQSHHSSTTHPITLLSQHQATSAAATATTITNPSSQQPLQLTSNPSSTITPTSSSSVSSVGPSINLVSTNISLIPAKSSTGHHGKASRRGRDHRGRSQEWPDVPDVGKIEESNPEVLAQKILETGRQIEAGKFNASSVTSTKPQQQQQQQQQNHLLSGKSHHRASSNNEQQLPPAVSVYTAPQDSTLMPAPALANKSHNQHSASSLPLTHNTSRSGISIIPKCELPGMGARKSSNNSHSIASQESPKVANFEDRLKSIITSALNEDQEHRKTVSSHSLTANHIQAQNNTTSGPSGPIAAHEIIPPPSPQQSPVPKRSKHSNTNASSNTNSNSGVYALHYLQQQQQQQQLNNSNSSSNTSVANSGAHNLNNIINVATQGLTHLNATTTISPITPPLSNNLHHHQQQQQQHSQQAQPSHHQSNANNSQYPPYMHGGGKYGSGSTAATSSSSSSTCKHPTPIPPSQQQPISLINNSSINASHKYPKYQQPATHLSSSQPSSYNAMTSDLLHPRRRGSVTAAVFEQLTQQHNQQQALLLAAATATNTSPVSNHAHQHHQQHLQNSGMEFKAPSLSGAAENIMIPSNRSNSRESIHNEELLNPRANSANSDNSMYYPPTRERLLNHERSVSRESAHHLNAQQPLQQPSRPNSTSSQPDYTQVSPAKMALRRHLSQEKLNQQGPTNPSMASGVGGSSLIGGLTPQLPTSTKTIGDLVNGEIERTLEISHQSIINAAVNMSTVGQGANGSLSNTRFLERNSSSNLSNISGQSLYGERFERESRDRSNERLLINSNSQRSDRVHLRIMEENSSIGSTNNFHNDISPRSTSSSSGRKSPTYAHNLATLANVAFTQKTQVNSCLDSKHSDLTNSRTSRAGANGPNGTASSYTNGPTYHQQTNSGRNSSSSSSTSNAIASSLSGRSRDYQPVALPRAEMKNCIESYFHEEHNQQQQQHHQQQQQQQHHQQQQQQHHIYSLITGKNKSSTGRSGRMNGANPPLEGLAASLQDHVMASRKYKEEHEERQRRAQAVSAMHELRQQNQQQQQQAQQQQGLHPQQSNHQQQTFNANQNAHHMGHLQQQPQQQQPMNHYQQSLSSNYNGNSSVKVEIGVKRTSPMAPSQPRPSKIPHYGTDMIMQQHQPQVNPNAIISQQQQQTANPNTATLQAHQHQHQQQHHHHHQTQQLLNSNPNNSYANTNGGLLHSAHPNPSPSPSPSSCSTSSSSASRRNKLHIEPMLMSPEINSIMNDDRPLQLSTSRSRDPNPYQTSQLLSTPLSNRATPIVGSADDDGLPDDETHWQHRVSSGFDRLVAFASTELDKTRRSIDTDTVPSSISCNTSPDSGITHSSNNSDGARTFLSTSSTSSQLDIPMSSGGSNSSNGGFTSLSHHHNPHGVDHLSDSSMKSTHSSDLGSTIPLSLKQSAVPSPLDPSAIESPPLSDIGLPRTPSPSTVATPPLLSTNANNNLKIPLKYQRKSKSSLEKHYKKKFCERNWDYDTDDLLNYNEDTKPADAVGVSLNPNTITTALSNGPINEKNLSSKNSSTVSNRSPKESGFNDKKDVGISNSSGSSTPTSLNHHPGGGVGNSNNPNSNHYNHSSSHHHKSSKFRPKGKDWDWSMDSNSNASMSATGSGSGTALPPAAATTSN